MLSCFAPPVTPARAVHIVSADGFPQWLAAASAPAREWLAGTGFKAKPGTASVLPGPAGDPPEALLVVNRPPEPWDAASLFAALPPGVWQIADPHGLLPPDLATLGWALAAYRFTRYRRDDAEPPRLVPPQGAGVERAMQVAEATWLGRDLVNTPASDLGPAELAEAVGEVAARFGAECRTIVGEALLGANYPAIHAVGRASDRAPRLIDLRWGEAGAPRVTLVGQGVCFDTGGLDIKPSSNMLLMKKDMGGAAVMLAVARCVMARDLPVRLRLLIPAV